MNMHGCVKLRKVRNDLLAMSDNFIYRLSRFRVLWDLRQTWYYVSSSEMQASLFNCFSIPSCIMSVKVIKL